MRLESQLCRKGGVESAPRSLCNLIPYQRRALQAGKCGVEVEGGVLPTPDWMLNLQILTSGGFH